MTEVHTQPAPGMAIDRQREARSLEIMENKPGFDIALLEESEFEAGLERIRIRQKRLQRIIDTILVPEVHYQTKDKNGNTIFEKPHLTIAGASELRNQFRLTCKPIEPPEVTLLSDYVNVSITVGCYDSAGRLLGSRAGACNTLERRFKKRGNAKGYIYDDPREMVHQCMAMAEKRGAKLITAEVTGAVAFFANEDAMEAALEDEAAPPWTAAEQQSVLQAARKAGIKSEGFGSLVREVLGHEQLGQIRSGAEVEKLLKAIQERAGKPVPAAGNGSQRSLEDDEFERRLAQE